MALLAVTTAILFAASSVTAKRGLATTTVMAGLLVSLLMTGLVTLVAAVIDWPDSWPLAPIVLFAVSGLLGDGLGRVAFLGAVHRLGPSTAVPIPDIHIPDTDGRPWRCSTVGFGVDAPVVRRRRGSPGRLEVDLGRFLEHRTYDTCHRTALHLRCPPSRVFGLAWPTCFASKVWRSCRRPRSVRRLPPWLRPPAGR